MTELQLALSAITRPGWNFDQGVLWLTFVALAHLVMEGE
jgi:hypothetical protein